MHRVLRFTGLQAILHSLHHNQKKSVQRLTLLLDTTRDLMLGTGLDSASSAPKYSQNRTSSTSISSNIPVLTNVSTRTASRTSSSRRISIVTGRPSTKSRRTAHAIVRLLAASTPKKAGKV
ncbi:uncharacterized protein RCC_08910 [Ramularia collo-cygni]|uniref:Uncharacterized protein n=1 Tax=Ramularia collo-cygni TaxID=112498 RepID=A0A2D3V8F5_9PEZI|nr:uncharacterized protein RCC_08910 [Ramularia collo-cygni]CZT23200.1 uncharacterized protein RCC_08910 [Ramularia collo-cygni]